MPMTLFYIFASDCPHRTAGFFIEKNGRRFDIWKSIGYGCFFMGSRFHGFFEVMVDWTHTSIGIKRDAFLHVCWDAADGAEPNTFEVFCRWMPLAFFLGSSFWNQSFYETWNTMADRKVNSGRCQETFCQGTLLNDCQTGCCFNLDIFHLSQDDGPDYFFVPGRLKEMKKPAMHPVARSSWRSTFSTRCPWWLSSNFSFARFWRRAPELYRTLPLHLLQSRFQIWSWCKDVWTSTFRWDL